MAPTHGPDAWTTLSQLEAPGQRLHQAWGGRSCTWADFTVSSSRLGGGDLQAANHRGPAPLRCCVIADLQTLPHHQLLEGQKKGRGAWRPAPTFWQRFKARNRG